MAETIKLSEIAKRFKITSKDIIAKLSDYGVTVKSATSLVNEDQISLIFEIYTQQNMAEEAAVIAERAALREQTNAEKAAKEAEEKAKAEKAEAERAAKEAEEKAAKEAEEKAKAEKEAAEKAKKKAEEKAKKTDSVTPNLPPSNKKADAEKTEKAPADRRKHQKKQAKKQGGQKIDLSNVDHSDTSEEYIVKTSEHRRHVDTRQSTIETDSIDNRERIESLAENIRMDGGRRRNNKKGKGKQDKTEKVIAKPKQKPKPKVITEIEIPETIAVGEFASMMGKTGAEVVKKLMMLGVMATLNQSIDFETAQLIGDEFGITVNQEVVLTKEDRLFMDIDETDKEEDLKPRPPVVVVMGHVDHGKTSLLDAIRHTSVISTEAGGITQHIGAYSVTLNDRIITFLDTPGHEAFTTMRARGAQVTDVAILVVAADDGVMPQTIEAINHAKAAGVTIIVAINKIDKEGANPDRVKQMLMEYDLVPEEWGGDTVCVEVSAKQKINIDGLLEMVLLVADMQELKANPNRSAIGTVIEAKVDKGRGPVATVLVQNGTLKVGDFIIAGTAVGHVRAMVNDKGRRVKTAAPSTPVEVVGLNEAPTGGDKMYVVARGSSPAQAGNAGEQVQSGRKGITRQSVQSDRRGQDEGA